MAALKQNNLEKVNQNFDNLGEDQDLDLQYEQWKEEQQLIEGAEKAAFMNIFDLTGTYPM